MRSKKYVRLKSKDKDLLSANHLVELLRDTQKLFAMPLNPAKGVKVSTLLTNFAHTQDYSLDEKLRFIETSLPFINPLGTEWRLNAKINGTKIDLNLSRLRIVDLGPLANLPINKLDVSNTNIKNIEVLFDSSIQELDARNTPLNGVMLRHLKKLKRLILSPQQLPHFELKGGAIIRK